MNITKVDNDMPTDYIQYQMTNPRGQYLIDKIKQRKEYWVFAYPPKDSDYALDLTPKKVKPLKQYEKVYFELEIGGSISGTVYENDRVTLVKEVDIVTVSENSGFRKYGKCPYYSNYSKCLKRDNTT